MDIRKHHLQQAVEQQIISGQQADALWQLWQSQQSTVPQFSFNHVLYYLGGLLAIFDRRYRRHPVIRREALPVGALEARS